MQLSRPILLAMKLTALLLTVFLVQVSARSVSQTVTFSGKNVSLEQLFAVIEKQTGYVIFCEYSILQDAHPVTIEAKATALPGLLEQVFAGQPYAFSITGNTIAVRRRQPTSYEVVMNAPPPPPVTLKGRVISTRGDALEGAVVADKISGKQTVANASGWFTLKEIDAGKAVLVVSFIGYETSIVAVKGRAEVEVVLTQAVKSLDDAIVQVVNNGYQSISRERSAGSYAKPDKEVYQNRSTSMNVIQRLEGLVPGLAINNAPASKADAQSNGVLIRGISSVNSNRAPLYVVDGIPLADINSINPNDVADITVLKDATASSIWGSLASNGVVVITTRKGKTGQLQADYDGFISFRGKPDIDYFPVLTSSQFITAAKEMFDPSTPASWDEIKLHQSLNSWGVAPHEVIMYNEYRGLISPARAQAQLDSLSAVSNLSQIKSLWYRNALLTNHTVSLSMGTEKYSLYGSAAYTGNWDNLPGNRNNSYKINLRQDLRLNRWLSAYLITDITNTVTWAGRSASPDNRFLPYALFRDNNGNNLSMSWLYWSDTMRTVNESKSRLSLDYVPLDERSRGYTKSDALLARINTGVTVKLSSNFRFEGVYGLVKGTNKTSNYDDITSYPMRSELLSFTVASATAGGVPTYYLPTNGGKLNLNNLNRKDWTVRNQLVFDYATGNQQHKVTALAGQEAQEQLSNITQSTVRGYNEQLMTYAQINYNNLIATGVTGSLQPNSGSKSVLTADNFKEQETRVRVSSYYSNAAYTYLNKYTVNVSGRIDRSSLFGVDKSAQNKPVWSVGGKWLAGGEAFLQNNHVISFLAVRATYGITGNPPMPGSAASFDILSAAANSLAASGLSYSISTPANKKLTWESTKIYNGGIDFGVLQNRLKGSVDFYLKKTSNLISRLPVNAFSGYQYIIGNVGDLNNKGVELQLSTLNISRKSFSWATNLVLAYNTNKITRLNLNSPLVTGGDVIKLGFREGYSAAAIFAYPFGGLDAKGDPQVRLTDGTLVKANNATKPQDIRYMGTYQPKITGSVMNEFRYKSFSLTVNIVFNLGGVMRRDVNQLFDGSRLVPGAGSLNTGNVHAEFSNRWKKPGDEAVTNVPSIVGNNAARFTERQIDYYTMADMNVLSSDYIKLRDITFAWQLPAALLRSVKMKAVTLRAQLNNVLLWKANNYGIDPEFQDAFGGSLSNTTFLYGPGNRTVPVAQHAITLGAHITL